MAFRPGATGPRSGTVTITHNAPGSPFVLDLAGTGTESVRSLAVNPGGINFASQTVGTTSQSQFVTLTNHGNTTVTLSDIAFSGDFAPPQFAFNCGALPANLSAGQSCTVSISFTPVEAGARAGTLTITHNATGSPHTVQLSGTGLASERAVQLTPLGLSFGEQVLGQQSASQIVTYTSRGNTSVTISNIEVSGDFLLVPGFGCTTFPVTLNPNTSCTFQVAFRPGTAGTHAGAITFTDNAPGSPRTVVMAGTGVEARAALAITPLSVSFARQVIGTLRTQQVRVTNSGNVAVSITSVSSSGDFSLQSGCFGQLPAGSSCTITVRFIPTVAGARNAVLTIEHGAPGSPAVIPLSGTGIEAGEAVSLSQSRVDFGTVRLGSTSTAATIHYANIGATAASITGIVSSEGFPVSHDCGASLAASSSCSIRVSFAPAVTGPQGGMLVVTDNAGGSPRTVQLSGTGSSPQLAVSANQVDFGGQLLGASGAAKPVTVTNSGNAELAISSIAASGDFSHTNDCGTLLPAGATCTVQVRFTPGSVGPRSGSLTIASDAPGSPRSIPLTGSGTDLVISPAAGSATVATVTAGQTASYQLQLAPAGGFTGTLALSCSGAPATTNCTVSPASVNLTGGTAATATVSVTTTARTSSSAFRFPGSGREWPISPWMPLTCALLLFGSALWLAIRGNRPRRLAFARLAVVLIAVASLASCGGGNGTTTPTSPNGPVQAVGTPAGTYVLVVNVAVEPGVTRTIQLTLTVN